MPTGLHCLLVGGIDYWLGETVKCRRPAMAGSVAEVQSHDEGKGERSVTRVHGSVTGIQNKSVPRSMEK